jgi:hypothetical protein
LYASSSSSSTADTVDESSSDKNNTPRDRLRSDLEEYRIEKSRSMCTSPSVILPDNVIDGICTLDPLPLTVKDLSKVKGLGPKKLELFGAGILDLVSSAPPKATSDPLDSANDTTLSSTITITGDANEGGGIESPLPVSPSSNVAPASLAAPPSGDAGRNTALPRSPPTAPILRTGMEETSRYSNQIEFNQSHLQQQQQTRSNSSSSSAIKDDSSDDNNPENETSIALQESIGALQESIGALKVTDNNLQPKERLRSDLENYRNEQSKTLGKSPSAILSDKLIDGICALDPLPTTREDLLGVKGLGAKKLELVGDGILGLMSSTFAQTTAVGEDANDSAITEESSADTGSSNNNSDGSADCDMESSSSSSNFSLEFSSSNFSLDSSVAPFPAPLSYVAPSPDSEASTDETTDATSSFDSYVAPAPYSAPEPDNGAVGAFDSYVAPAPYSAPKGNTGIPAFDSYVAPAPYSAPRGSTGIPAFDSYVAPAPYSYIEEEDDEDEDDEISEESFGTSSPIPTKDNKEEQENDEGEKEKPKKLLKTQLKKDLKTYRVSQMEDGKAAYTVFTNAALDGIYASLPKTKSELLDVKGIGPAKLDLYGDDILELVAPYAGLKSQRDQGDASGDNTNILIQPKTIDPESLTLEQRKAADMIFGNDQEEEEGRRRNVFVTGSAGTGKSHLLKYIVEVLQGRHKKPGDGISQKRDLVVGVCAPTGVAAVIVGGSTLHSFFGIGLGTGSRSSLLKKVNQNTGARTRIDETDVLIIDECSMLSSDLLETLDMVARAVRKNGMFSDEPFGGMQVIAFGDFFQLPPVYRNDGSHDRSWRPFCFDSPVWSELGLSENIVELREVQRQDHEDFINLLNKVRNGGVENRDIWDLNQKCLVGPNNPLPNDGILPTRLYVLNRDVDSENITRLRELDGKEVVCKANDYWRQKMPMGTPASVKKKMKEGLAMQMPDEISLKVGAQVMLTRNKDLEKNLVNGSRGVVERFETNKDGNPVPIVRFDSGIITRIDTVESTKFNMDGGEGCLVRMQVPLKLAWAITIHKSQGSTLTRASLDISSAFEYGQCYVALSRVRSLEGLWLERPAELRNVMVSPQVVDFFSRNY